MAGSTIPIRKQDSGDALHAIARALEHHDPGDWPDAAEYRPAEIVEDIVRELIERLPEPFGDLLDMEVAALFRYKPKGWKKQGKTLFGTCQTATGLIRYYSDADFIILINWQVWTVMNPWQRLALVYHELRHAMVDEKENGDRAPAILPHDAEVFFDELELFGTDTYEQWQALGQQVAKGERVHNQYHLPLADAAAK